MTRRAEAPFDASAFRHRLLEWIGGEGAASRSIPIFIDSYARFLNREEFSIRRCSLATETVHPMMAHTQHAWFDEAVEPSPISPSAIVSRRQYRIGAALIDEVFLNAESPASPQYIVSPFKRIERDGELYEAIRPVGRHQAYPLFEELASLGCTAYWAGRLKSFAGLMQKLALATDRPGGFDPDRLDSLLESATVLTLHLNALVEHNIKETLARVYIGKDPGARVCKGMINLGQVVSLDAAIWFSDMRGFTSFIESGLTPERSIERLNEYFGAVAESIHAQGGEILKYIGDAVLAVFPLADGNAHSACRAALAAWESSERLLERMNLASFARGEDVFQHGVGLHIGTVSYGNIGSRDRLDFTVIGAAVNQASRIESLCKTLGETMLCSADFASASGMATRVVGQFELKGIPTKATLHAPASRV